ncbi:DUF222 domain-containing protein [Salinilacustrithrix flava]|uniref:HNH endonuclease signature motif containing protein n=1 Tax=Salinilacustrithrix flava TaxID=2957203 RepID=UPI003D7C1FF2
MQAEVRAVEGSDLDWSVVAGELVAIERERERFDHLIGLLVSDLQARGAHVRDGARNMATWLTQRTGQRRDITGSRCALADKLRSMPATDAAVGDGRITGSHAQVLGRCLNKRTADVFAEQEETLVGIAETMSADDLAGFVEAWLRSFDPDGPDPGEGPDDTFHLSQTIDGRLKGRFDLGSEGAIRAKAILDEVTAQIRAEDKAARDVDPTDPRAGETMSRRRARALLRILDRAAVSPRNPAGRQPLFTVHTNLPTITGTASPEEWMAALELQWRAAVPAPLLERWLCDASVARMVLDAEGLVLDHGRAVRTATAAQRRALVARDGPTCAVPGCDIPAGWTQAHHVEHWKPHGLTDLDNLHLGCEHHHARIHAGELVVEMIDGRPRFSLPDGRPLSDPRAGPPRVDLEPLAPAAPPGDPPPF